MESAPRANLISDLIFDLIACNLGNIGLCRCGSDRITGFRKGAPAGGVHPGEPNRIIHITIRQISKNNGDLGQIMK